MPHDRTGPRELAAAERAPLSWHIPDLRRAIAIPGKSGRRGKSARRSLAAAATALAAGLGTVAAAEPLAPTSTSTSGSTPTQTVAAPASGLLERDTLTGDWAGARPWLKDNGITLKPRVSQFYQRMTSGDGDNGFEYGGKADVILDSDLHKLGTWEGLSLSVHAEYNFGQSVNQRGGTIMPVNTALMFPGIEGSDAFDISNATLKQQFGDCVSFLVGKISIIDYCDGKPFMGGSGIDSFWNIVFAAPPSGTVPAYFLGGILTAKTDIATFGL